MPGGRAFTVPQHLRTDTGPLRDWNVGDGAEGTASVRMQTGGVSTARRWGNNLSTAIISPPPVGFAPSGAGWRQTVAENADETLLFDAGTWTIIGRFNRSSGLGTVNVNGDVTPILYRMSSAGVFQEELGRVTATHSFTTAQANTTFNISVGAFTMDPGDLLQVEIYVDFALAAVVTTDYFIVLNTTTTSRLTAAPNYLIQYARSVADTSAATDVVDRAYVGARVLADTATATDDIQRVYTASRALSDTATATDALTRVYLAVRNLSETAAATDVLARNIIVTRSLSDTAAATDSLQRQISYSRPLSDTATATDALARVVAFFRDLSDTAAATDVLARTLTLTRALADTAGASDALARTVTYVRNITDNLAASTTIVKKIYMIED